MCTCALFMCITYKYFTLFSQKLSRIRYYQSKYVFGKKKMTIKRIMR